MRNTTFSLMLAVLSSMTAVGCGGASMMTTPTAMTPSSMGVSVQAVVIGMGAGSAYGEGLTLSVRVMSGAAAVSARLEISFTDGSAAIEVPFSPAGIRVTPMAPASLSASVPAASDSRMMGRAPGALRAIVTLRDDNGREETLFLPISAPAR